MKNNKKVDLTNEVPMNFSAAELVQIQSALDMQIERELREPVTPLAIFKEVERIQKIKDNTIEDLKLLASMTAFVRIDQQLRELVAAAVEAKIITKKDLDDAEKETPRA